MISCAQAEKNKNDERKYNATDDGGNSFFAPGKVVQILFIQELWIR